MADNVILPGTGAVVATDDVGGAQVQILKIGLGADGVIDTLLDSGQQLAANSVPVVLPATQITTLTPPAAITGFATSAKQDTLLTELQLKADLTETQPVSIAAVVHVDDNAGTLTVDGTVTANLSATDNAVLDAIQTAVETIDNAISGSEMQVDVLTMPTVTIQDGGGAITVDGTVTANTGLTQPLTDTQLRNTAVPVSVATIPSHAVTNAGTFKVQEDGAALTALQLIDNMISGSEAQVDIVGALPAGTALIGKVGIDQATANANEVVVKSGTVTAVTSITNAVAVTNAGITTIAGAVAGTEMQVDVLTMPTVTVNAHAVTNAGTFATQADITKVAGASVAVSNGTADTSLRVTIASDSTGQVKLAAGTDGIGKLTANDGVDIGNVDVASIAAGDNNIGNVDIVTLPALPAGTALIGKFGIDQATANANEVVVKSGTVTAVTSITNAVTVNAHAVTNAGTFATQVDGAALTALQLIDNCISGSEAQVDVVAALPAGDNNIGNVDIVTGPTGANALQIQGTVASGSAAANNPMLNGAKAVNAEPAAVDANDVISLITDLVGKLITLPYANPENFISGTTAAITDTTRTALIASQGGSLRTYITQLTVTNSHATVGTMVKLEDNTTTIYQAYAPPGGGFVITFPVPLKGTAATAWNVSPVTTGASVIANASGYKGI